MSFCGWGREWKTDGQPVIGVSSPSLYFDPPPFVHLIGVDDARGAGVR